MILHQLYSYPSIAAVFIVTPPYSHPHRAAALHATSRTPILTENLHLPSLNEQLYLQSLSLTPNEQPHLPKSPYSHPQRAAVFTQITVLPPSESSRIYPNRLTPTLREQLHLPSIILTPTNKKQQAISFTPILTEKLHLPSLHGQTYLVTRHYSHPQ